MEGKKAAIIIIPLEVASDLFSVQVVPMDLTKPCNDPILCQIQKYWNHGRKTMEELLASGNLKSATKIDKSKNKR